MARQRTVGKKNGGMVMFFGARSPDTLPYFGPLNKVPSSLLQKHLVFSRMPGQDKEYVQDRMRVEEDIVAEMLDDAKTHIYILRAERDGGRRRESAFTNIAESIGQQWTNLRDVMRDEGRYHVETY